MDAADGRLVAVADWLFGVALLEVSYKPVDQIGHLAVCGRSDGWDVVIDGILGRTAGKSVRYAGKLVVPEPPNAGRRHLQLLDSQRQFSAPNFVPVGAGSS